MLAHNPGPSRSIAAIIRRRTSAGGVAVTSQRVGAGKNRAARSSSTSRRPGGSLRSTAASTMGPNAFCATGFRATLALVQEAGIDGQGDAGDVARVIGHQPRHRVGDVVRREDLHR
jgi:hypothetical protein